MASFGAKCPMFAPIQSEPDTGMPTYGEVVTIGRLIKADMTIATASGKLYADDGLSESVDEFSSATIAMETDDMLDDVASVVYGVTVEEKKVTYKAGDEPPLGGLGYLKYLMRNGKKLYKAYFYPKVKAVMGNDSAQTKSDSITFGTNSISFTVYETQDGTWKQTGECETLEEGKAWLKSRFSPESGTATEPEASLEEKTDPESETA